MRGYIVAFAWNSVHAKDIFPLYNGINTRGMCAIPICSGLCHSICVTQCLCKNVHWDDQMNPKICNNCRMWVQFESDIEFKKGAGMSISNWITVQNIPWNYMMGRFCCPNIQGAVFQIINHYNVVDFIRISCILRIFYCSPNIQGASMF